MNKLITLSFLLSSFAAISNAQPVIGNGNNLPAIGYNDSVALAISAMSPGNAGADQTWDFTTLNATVMGKAKIVDPATTPYVSSFAGTNFCIEIMPNGAPSMYHYNKVSADKYEVLGGDVSSAGGRDYTQNPKTILPFPFHYNDVVADTFIKTSTGQSAVVQTYDGYGTLKTPYGTYTNVVRVKNDYGGTDVDFEWFTVSPVLFQIMVYSTSESRFLLFDATSATGVSKLSKNAEVKVFPNPAGSQVTVSINNIAVARKAVMTLTDCAGRIVRSIDIHTQNTVLQRDGIADGLYFYTLRADDNVIAQGKLLFQ